MGKNYLTLCLPEQDRAGVAEQLENAHAGFPVKGYENPILTRSGDNPTFVWNASLLRGDQGRRLGALSVGHDISERKRAELALRRSEASLEKAQALAHLGSYEIDLIGQNHVWSDEARRIVGLHPTDVLPSREEALRNLVHPEDQARVREAFTRAVVEGADFDLEYRIACADGTVRFVHVMSEALRVHITNRRLLRFPPNT